MGVPEARGGVVTVIQRSSSDMKLNPHLHAIAVDGVYVPGPDGIPSFRALPRLTTDEVGDVLQVARVRILRYLARRGVVRLLPEARSRFEGRLPTALSLRRMSDIGMFCRLDPTAPYTQGGAAPDRPAQEADAFREVAALAAT